MDSIDFTQFERHIADFLTAQGFEAELMEEGVSLKFKIYDIFRQKISIASVPDSTLVTLAGEVRHKILHPVWGQIDYLETIALGSDSVGGALQLAAEMVANTTVAGLLRLIDNRADTGGDHIELESYPNGVGGPKIDWEVISSKRHLAADQVSTEALNARFNEQPGFILALDTLTGQLTAPSLILLKLGISAFPSGEIEFDCHINGDHSAEGCAEMREKWKTGAGFGQSSWDYSQFFIIHPKEIARRNSWRTDSKDPGSEVSRVTGTYATSAPLVKIDFRHYFRNANSEGCIAMIALFFAVIATVCFAIGWWWLGILPAILAALIVYVSIRNLVVQKGVYYNALLVPGVIVDVKPIKVVVLAPLATSSFSPTRGNSLKVVFPERLPHHAIKLGERVPCVAYFNGKEEGYWLDFTPQPIAWGTRNLEEVSRCRDKIGEEDFILLETYVAEGKYPKDRKGIYKVDNPSQKPPSLPKKRR